MNLFHERARLTVRKDSFSLRVTNCGLSTSMARPMSLTCGVFHNVFLVNNWHDILVCSYKCLCFSNCCWYIGQKPRLRFPLSQCTSCLAGEKEEILYQVKVPIIDRNVCTQSDWLGDKITESMLCAGYPEGGKDTCQVSLQSTYLSHQIFSL